MPSVLSAEIKKRGGDLVDAGNTWNDTYRVVCQPGCTQKTVADYMRDTKGIAPNKLGDSAMLCTSLRITTATPDGQLWDVTATYTSIQYAYSPVDGGLTPLDEPWGIHFGKTTISQVVDKAYCSWIEGQTIPDPVAPPATKIVNTALDPFDPPLMQDVILPTIELEKNVTVSAFSSMLAAALDDTVNSSATTVAGRAIAKWAGRVNLEGTRAYYYAPGSGNPILYYKAKIVITIHPQTWARFVLNTGLRGMEMGGDGTFVRAKEAGYKDKRADTFVKLDENGYFNNTAGYEGIYIGFLTYDQNDWSALNLPSSASTE